MTTPTSEAELFLKNAQREFEIRYLRCRGTAFQDFFADVMEAAFGSDFQRVRPHGLDGDLKSDGYLRSHETVYQAYAPDDMRDISKLLKKIDTDFRGAMVHWAGRVKCWTFVHNSFSGLPAKAIQLLQDLGRECPMVQNQQWGFNEMWHLVSRLESSQLIRLFPNLQSSGAFRSEPTVISMQLKTHYWTWLTRHLKERERLLVQATSVRFSTPIRLTDPSIQTSDRAPHQSRPPGNQHNIGQQEAKQGLNYDLTSFASQLHAKRRILLEGEAGSGKSTFLRRFARRELWSLQRQSSHVRIRGKTPILIDLKMVDERHTVEDLIQGAIREAGVFLSHTDLRYLQRRGYLTYLLDGLDEVPETQRARCIRQVESLATDGPQCDIVMASRPFPHTKISFARVSIAPLQDSDIAGACSQAFGSKKDFKLRFEGVSADTYVSQNMSPELRRLCRWPLTLRMVLDTIKRDGKAPSTLFETYERFVLWRYEWEHSRARATNLTAYFAAAEILTDLASDLGRKPLRTDWVNAVSRRVFNEDAHEPHRQTAGETMVDALLASGLIISDSGEVRFSHKSFEEFFRAKHVIRTCQAVGQPVVSDDLAVCRFLCGALSEFVDILEHQLGRCDNIETLMPLLEECKNTGRDGGRFQDLYHAYHLSRELGIELCYSMYGDRPETFISEIQGLVDTCVGIGPKAMPILRTAASEILNGTPFVQSSRWFGAVTVGLQALGWKGAPLHKSLAEAGFFDHLAAFSIDGSESRSRELAKQANYDAFCQYLKALDEDDFVKATKSLVKLTRVLVPRARRRKSTSINLAQHQLQYPERSCHGLLPFHCEQPLASLLVQTKPAWSRQVGQNDTAHPPLAASGPYLPSLSIAPPARHHLRQEPDAGNPPVRICAGGTAKAVSLPRQPYTRCEAAQTVLATLAWGRAYFVSSGKRILAAIITGSFSYARCASDLTRFRMSSGDQKTKPLFSR
jgi:hypothetical protein